MVGVEISMEEATVQMDLADVRVRRAADTIGTPSGTRDSSGTPSNPDRMAYRAMGRRRNQPVEGEVVLDSVGARVSLWTTVAIDFAVESRYIWEQPFYIVEHE